MQQHNSCSNQDHKKNNHAQDTKSYPGKTLLNQGKNPKILCYRVKRISPFHHNPSAEKRVLYDQERLRLREVCTSSLQVGVERMKQ